MDYPILLSVWLRVCCGNVPSGASEKKNKEKKFIEHHTLATEVFLRKFEYLIKVKINVVYCKVYSWSINSLKY